MARTFGPPSEIVVSPVTNLAYRCETISVLDQQLRKLAQGRNAPAIFWHQTDAIKQDLDFLLETRLKLMLERDFRREAAS